MFFTWTKFLLPNWPRFLLPNHLGFVQQWICATTTYARPRTVCWYRVYCNQFDQNSVSLDTCVQNVTFAQSPPLKKSWHCTIVQRTVNISARPSVVTNFLHVNHNPRTLIQKRKHLTLCICMSSTCVCPAYLCMHVFTHMPRSDYFTGSGQSRGMWTRSRCSLATFRPQHTSPPTLRPKKMVIVYPRQFWPCGATRSNPRRACAWTWPMSSPMSARVGWSGQQSSTGCSVGSAEEASSWARRHPAIGPLRWVVECSRMFWDLPSFRHYCNPCRVPAFVGC